MKPLYIKRMMMACSLFHFFVGVCTAQDPHFSQFFESPLYRNPALSGIFTGDVRVQAVFRDQWNSIANAYKTGSLNAEYKQPVGPSDDFLTLGMLALYDRAGTIGWTTTQLLPALTYHKSLSTERNRYLSVGFMGGWVQKSFDRSKMTTNSNYDGQGDGEPLTNTSYSYLDGSVGISYNATIKDNDDDNYYLGLAYHHFTRPNQSFYRDPSVELNPKWVFSGGLRFGVSEFAYVTVQADHSRQGQFNESIVGGMVGLKLGPDPVNPPYVFHAGAYLRFDDALIPVVKLDYFPFSFALSYDVNVSRLRTSSLGRGGVELSVSFVKSLDRENGALNAVRCPRF